MDDWFADDRGSAPPLDPVDLPEYFGEQWRQALEVEVTTPTIEVVDGVLRFVLPTDDGHHYVAARQPCKWLAEEP